VRHEFVKQTTDVLRPWTQAVRLNSDVESGNTSVAAYAIDLGSVIAGVKSVSKLYREAEPFFQVTYPTTGHAPPDGRSAGATGGVSLGIASCNCARRLAAASRTCCSRSTTPSRIFAGQRPG